MGCKSERICIKAARCGKIDMMHEIPGIAWDGVPRRDILGSKPRIRLLLLGGRNHIANYLSSIDACSPQRYEGNLQGLDTNADPILQGLVNKVHCRTALRSISNAIAVARICRGVNI